MAPYRTTGEQVGHLLFRKSTMLRSNNIAGQKDGSNVAMQGSQDDIYANKEAREYFTS